MATSISAEFLQLNEHPMVDTSVDSLEFYEIQLANPDTEDNPRFTIDYTDQWVLPKEGYMQIKGETVTEADGSWYAAGDIEAFGTNGTLQLFDWAVKKNDN